MWVCGNTYLVCVCVYVCVYTRCVVVRTLCGTHYFEVLVFLSVMSTFTRSLLCAKYRVHILLLTRTCEEIPLFQNSFGINLEDGEMKPS